MDAYAARGMRRNLQRMAVISSCLVAVLGLLGMGTAASAATPTASVAANYVPVASARVLDTRVGIGAVRHSVGPGASVVLHINGHAGVPSTGIAAAVLNITVTAPS
ncbi:MAG: hypothetical protein JWN95_3298, partial [Frankiales bacterium]|nr:hypothetical protein [Frankiales bacterium]